MNPARYTRPDPKTPGASVWLSGKEYHLRGTPRRRRKTWCVRLGVRNGCAYGGCCMFPTEPEARAFFKSYTRTEAT